MLEWDLGVEDASFIKDESAHLDYVENIPYIGHLGAISALKASMVIECFVSIQLSSSNSIRGALIQIAIPQLREMLGTGVERMLGVFKRSNHLEAPFETRERFSTCHN